VVRRGLTAWSGGAGSGQHEAAGVPYCCSAPQGHLSRAHSLRESCRPSGSWALTRPRLIASGDCANSAGSRGHSIAIAFRCGEGRNERLAEFAVDLVRINVDVLVTSRTAQVFAAEQATSVIPIVFAAGLGTPMALGPWTWLQLLRSRRTNGLVVGVLLTLSRVVPAVLHPLLRSHRAPRPCATCAGSPMMMPARDQTRRTSSETAWPGSGSGTGMSRSGLPAIMF
jgi:hypothetical protein